MYRMKRYYWGAKEGMKKQVFEHRIDIVLLFFIISIFMPKAAGTTAGI
jgi:hypothetical protein